MKITIVVLILSVAAGCSSSTKQDASSASRIVKLTVPASVRCNGKTSTKVPVSYETTGDNRRQLIIDGLAQPDPVPASGTLAPPVHCDGVEHTVALVLTDAHGKTASVVRSFATTLG